MHSREGEGRAKRTYLAAGASLEAVGPTKGKGVIGALARQTNEDEIGFWLLWHIRGGFDGLERYGMHRATIFRKIHRFRQGFGVHPDVFELPGVIIDVKAYWEAATESYLS